MITDMSHPPSERVIGMSDGEESYTYTGACVFLIYALLVSGQPVTSDEDPLIECGDKGDSCKQCYKSLDRGGRGTEQRFKRVQFAAGFLCAKW